MIPCVVVAAGVVVFCPAVVETALVVVSPGVEVNVKSVVFSSVEEAALGDVSVVDAS